MPPSARAGGACAHCGLPVPDSRRSGDEDGRFCCAGCETAYAIIHEHGLDDYYAFAERRGDRVRASGQIGRAHV